MVFTNGTTIAIGTFASIIIIVVFGVVAYIIGKKGNAIPEIKKDTLVEIMGMERFTGGHTEGFVQEIKKHHTGRYIVTFYPTDLTQDEIENKFNGKIPLIPVITNKIHMIPRGRQSRLYNKLKILPKNISEMADSLKDMPEWFRKGFADIKTKEYVEDSIYGGMNEGNQALTDIAREMASGELTREHLLQLRGLFEEAAKQKLEIAPKPKMEESKVK